jgi:MGT family glycosyltransferase
MATLAIVCPPVSGHMNPSNALGRTLAARGHRVLHINVQDAAGRVAPSGLELVVVGETVYPLGSLDRDMAELGRLTGLAPLRFTMGMIETITQLLIDELPRVLQREGVDLVLADEASPGAATACAGMGLPWVTLSNALIVRLDTAVPLAFTALGPARGRLDRWRNRVIQVLFRWLCRGVTRVLNKSRAATGVPLGQDPDMENSPWLHLAQLPACLAFPRDQPIETLALCGPLVDPDGRAPVPFPWEKLDGRPLIYASMGTVQNRIRETFANIAAACADSGAQLVLSLGGSATPEALGDLPGEPLVVGFAPQLELLERADLFVTHGGMNSALEGLRAGVPMVVLPVGNDQPGVGAIIQHFGAGLSLGTSRPGLARLRIAIGRVRGEAKYRNRARALAVELAKQDGREVAADRIEGVLARVLG